MWAWLSKTLLGVTLHLAKDRLRRWWGRDVVKVNGTWMTRMVEPDASGERHPLEERVQLRQFFGFVWGVLVPGKKERKYLVRGDIFHETFTGKFELDGSRSDSTINRGVFMLRLSDCRKKMEGFSAWHDKDTGQIECSRYEWEKLDIDF